jgi:hypothetical protein
MSTSIFGGGQKAPKADPKVDKASTALLDQGPKLIGRANAVQTWIDKYDADRQKLVNPMISKVGKQANALSATGAGLSSTFNSDYKPAMDLQALDAAGASWLSPEAHKAQIDALLQRKIAGGANAAQANQDANYEKSLIDSQTTAENNAVGTATADAAQAEGRNVQGLSMEAGRMGIDPSRILAAQGANASNSTAAAVDAAQRARFGVRAENSAALNSSVNTGLAVNNQGNQATEAAASVNTSNVGNVNQTWHERVGDRNASLPWYSLGLNATNQGGQLALGKTQANQNAANVNQQSGNNLDSAIGTGFGLWASGGFKT